MHVNKVIDNYNILKQYCDIFWTRIQQNYHLHMQCARGCDKCCILQTVNLLEAYIISKHLRCFQILPKKNSQEPLCAFLFSGNCLIYEVRPLICRTHGLLLKSIEFEECIKRSCELNFIDPSLKIDSGSILDIDIITHNAAKLNCAFALSSADLSYSALRINLYDIYVNNLPSILTSILDAQSNE